MIHSVQTPKTVLGKTRVVNNSYWEEITEQEIPDHDIVRVFGSHVAVGLTETILSEAATGQQFYLAAADEVVATSSSNSDSAGGTGALTLLVRGLTVDGSDWNVDTDTITLTGEPGTGTTTKKFIRVFDAETLTAGSAGANVGTITLTDQGATGTFMKMTPGHNKTKAAVYTVPTGKELMIRNLWATTAGTKSIEVHLYKRTVGGVFVLETEFSLQDSSFDTEILLNSLSAKTDVEMRVQTAVGTAGVCKGGWLGRIENL
jgi:hypothetical protein